MDHRLFSLWRKIAKIVVMLSILGITLFWFHDTWHLRCDIKLKVWCVVWIFIQLASHTGSLLLAVIALRQFRGYCDRFTMKGPTVLAVVKTTIAAANIGWLCYGTVPVFIDEACEQSTRTFGQVFWWFGFIFRVIPMFIILSCLPFIFFMQPEETPPESEEHVSPDLLAYLEVVKYSEAKKKIKLASTPLCQEDGGPKKEESSTEQKGTDLRPESGRGQKEEDISRSTVNGEDISRSTVNGEDISRSTVDGEDFSRSAVNGKDISRSTVGGDSTKESLSMRGRAHLHYPPVLSSRSAVVLPVSFDVPIDIASFTTPTAAVAKDRLQRATEKSRFVGVESLDTTSGGDETAASAQERRVVSHDDCGGRHEKAHRSDGAAEQIDAVGMGNAFTFRRHKGRTLAQLPALLPRLRTPLRSQVGCVSDGSNVDFPKSLVPSNSREPRSGSAGPCERNECAERETESSRNNVSEVSECEDRQIDGGNKDGNTGSDKRRTFNTTGHAAIVVKEESTARISMDERIVENSCFLPETHDREQYSATTYCDAGSEIESSIDASVFHIHVPAVLLPEIFWRRMGSEGQENVTTLVSRLLPGIGGSENHLKLRRAFSFDPIQTRKRNSNISQQEMAWATLSVLSIGSAWDGVRRIGEVLTRGAERRNSVPVSVDLTNACPICYIDFEDEDDVVTLPCDVRHLFHPECIAMWFERSALCPTCRQDIGLLIKDKQDTGVALHGDAESAETSEAS